MKTYYNTPTLYTDIVLQEEALRRALARRDAEIQQLIRNAREMQAQIDKLEAEAKAERYAKETMYHEEPMW